MDEEAKLLVVSHGKDEDGYSVENKIEYPVYVSEKSVSRTEFYKALSEHINLKMILELRQEDWNQTEHIVNGKKEYASRVADGGTDIQDLKVFCTVIAALCQKEGTKYCAKDIDGVLKPVEFSLVAWKILEAYGISMPEPDEEEEDEDDENPNQETGL